MTLMPSGRVNLVATARRPAKPPVCPVGLRMYCMSGEGQDPVIREEDPS